jgi:hypothetical protein
LGGLEIGRFKLVSPNFARPSTSLADSDELLCMSPALIRIEILSETQIVNIVPATTIGDRKYERSAPCLALVRGVVPARVYHSHRGSEMLLLVERDEMLQ